MKRMMLLSPLIVLLVWAILVLLLKPQAPPFSQEPSTNEEIIENQPPIVDAGLDQQLSKPGDILLTGKVTDDELPQPPGSLTTIWEHVSGSNQVTILDPFALETTAQIRMPGMYVIRLSASDGQLTGMDEITIIIEDNSQIFHDLPKDHWAFDEIHGLHQAGYLQGCRADPPMFCPQAPLTRAEAAVLLLRGIHGPNFQPEDSAHTKFTDVPQNAWYAKWIASLSEAGLSEGCASDPPRYCPNRTQTRVEGTVLFLRMIKGADFHPSPAEGLFADIDPASWEAKWAEAGYHAGLINPCAQKPNPLFCPDAPLSRVQAAMMLYRAIGNQLP
jgi:hypothetical protein